MTCPNAETLLLHAYGELEESRVERHATDCRECREELRAIAELRSTYRTASAPIEVPAVETRRPVPPRTGILPALLAATLAAAALWLPVLEPSAETAGQAEVASPQSEPEKTAPPTPLAAEWPLPDEMANENQLLARRLTRLEQTLETW